MFSTKQSPARAPEERYRPAGASEQVRYTNCALPPNRSHDLSVRMNLGSIPPVPPPPPLGCHLLALPSVSFGCPSATLSAL